VKNIESFEDLHKIIEEYTTKDEKAVYRGVKSAEFELKPSIGREFTKYEIIEKEKKMMTLFKESSKGIHRHYPRK